MAGLLALSALSAAAGLSGAVLLAPAALGGPPAVLAPALALSSAAAVLSWGALADRLRYRLDDLVVPPRSWTQAGALLAAAALVVSAAGVAVAALERPADPATTSAAPTQGASADLWRGVAAWSRTAPPGRVLVVPATVGRLDPVVRRALGGRPWVGRDALPVSTLAATAALDDVLRRVSRGQAGPEVLDGLRRLGVGYVLVRDDLGAAVDRRRPSGLVRSALASSGATRDLALPGGTGHRGRRRRRGASCHGTARGVAAAGIGPRAGRRGGAAGRRGRRRHHRRPDGVRLLGPARPAWVTGGAGVLSDSADRRDVDQREAVDPDGPALTARQDRGSSAARGRRAAHSEPPHERGRGGHRLDVGR